MQFIRKKIVNAIQFTKGMAETNQLPEGVICVSSTVDPEAEVMVNDYILETPRGRLHIDVMDWIIIEDYGDKYVLHFDEFEDLNELIDNEDLIFCIRCKKRIFSRDGRYSIYAKDWDPQDFSLKEWDNNSERVGVCCESCYNIVYESNEDSPD